MSKAGSAFRITVLGGGGVGKTALTMQLVSHHFVEYYDPTIESSYRQQFLVDDEVAILDILDTAGQEEYTALQSQWIRSGEGFALVYSIDTRTSFDEIEKFRTKILYTKDVLEQDAPPMVLIGNKADLDDKREVSTEEGEALAERFKVDFFEASAKTRLNVQESFFTLVRRIRERQNPPQQNGNNENGEGGTKRKKTENGGKLRCVLF
ncbi:Ras-related protein R-Ras2 [Balamuthia mandrillaris]